MDYTLTQNDQIYFHLAAGNTITPIEALNQFKCFRLASRIKDLRNEGIRIEKEMITKNGKRYAEYKLPEPALV